MNTPPGAPAAAQTESELQEWLCPQASPVEIIARPPPLPEELIPELSTRIGHFATGLGTGQEMMASTVFLRALGCAGVWGALLRACSILAPSS